MNEKGDWASGKIQQALTYLGVEEAAMGIHVLEEAGNRY